MKPPTHREHKRFCEIDGWEEAGGGKDHIRYRRRLADGRVLRTRVSHGSGQLDDHNLWSRILRLQLEVTEEQFWEALATERQVDRAALAAPQEQAEEERVELDGWLVNCLINLVGLRDDEIRQLTADEAMARYVEWCESGNRE